VSGVYPFVIPITETFYDDVNLSWVKVRKQIDEQNWDEATTFTDSLGRTTMTQAKDSQGDVFTETKYDNLGRVAATSNPYREGDVKYWSKPRYDELNRVVETYAPAIEGQTGASLGITEFGISTVTDFVGTYTTATDASGRRARSITNALGQLVRIDEPTGNNQLGEIGSPNQPTFYKYNPQGKMVKVSQGQQNRYFLYDYLGRLIRVRQPEQEVNSNLNTTETIDGNNEWTAKMEYDLVGNLIKTTDAENKQITNTYDKAGRVNKREYSNLDTPTVFYHYDGTGLGAVPSYSKGKLTKVSSSISATQYTSFDNFGRTLTSEQITDGQTYTSKYKYNLSGALLEQTYPSGKVVRNFIESDGDLAKIVRNGKAYASDFLFTASGGIKSLKLGNGRFETAEFNARQQLTQVGLGSTTSTTDLWKLELKYGELALNGVDVDTAKNTGNIAKQIITLPTTSFTQTYRYDSLDRLTEAKETNPNGGQNWQQTFNYDRFGNRIGRSQTIGTQQLAINSQTLPTIDSSTNRFNLGQGFEYDKAGNITKDSSTGIVREFVFNGDNKQVHVKDASGNPIGTYFYDGAGKRVKKTTSLETTIFVYDASGKLVSEYSTQLSQNPTISYLTTDQLGTPRVITNKQGEVISRRDMMPFGEDLLVGIGARSTLLKYGVTDDEIRQKFTGYQKDKETNLNFAEARYYSNQFGIFTAVDPLLASGKSTNPQTFNRYVYVGDNPLRRIDPNGLIWMTDGTKYHWFKSTLDPNSFGWMVVKEFQYQTFGDKWVYLNPDGPSNKKGDNDFVRRGWELSDNEPVSMSGRIIDEPLREVGLDLVLEFEGLKGLPGLIKNLGSLFVKEEAEQIAIAVTKNGFSIYARKDAAIRAEKAVAEYLAAHPGADQAALVGGADIKSTLKFATTNGNAPEKLVKSFGEVVKDIGGVGAKHACGNTVGRCAEFRVANELMGRGAKLSDIVFSTPTRANNLNRLVHVCNICQFWSSPSQFPVGTTYRNAENILLRTAKGQTQW
jgi:RHS repeat-associated protein